MDNLPQRELPGWYANVLQYVVVPNWRFFSYFVTYCEFIIGVTFLIGLFVRPASLLGLVLTLNFIYIGGLSTELQQTYLALFIVMFWVGAGRCFGFDYYFYKRQRGLWW
jgi:thiosulfate dehydrogenase [quinone] large subunit